MIIDLHVHTPDTPGVPYTLSDLVSRAKAHGLDGFCITDIHTVKRDHKAKELAAKEGILVFIGFEAYTDRGHYLVFVPKPDMLPEISTWIRFNREGKSVFSSLVEAVEELKGVLIAAHPFDKSIPESPGDSLMQLKGVSAIEVLNANRPALTNELAEEVAAGIGLPGIGGSDTRSNLDSLGRYATLLLGAVRSEAELIEKILSHDVWPVAIGDPAFRQPEYRNERHVQTPQQRRHHSHHRSQPGQSNLSRSRSTTARGSPSLRSRQPSANSSTRKSGKWFSEKRGRRKSGKTPPPKPGP